MRSDGEIRIEVNIDSKDAEQGLKSLGEKAGSIGDKLKGGFAAAAKVGVAAIGAATAGVTALAKSALDSYGDYEQLVGGVETLFKQSSDVVMGYAANAYKTAGMSANQYMETVTSFSASLLQSLDGDTAAAAEKADQAITDMSDNANKMGTAMESIQNAYQGFAKQNFTMLDNLKLGYGGTKEEMERLLADAEKISGIKYDLSSYADIVDAIHVVQTEMGITGTTAKEASSTIQGSIASMGAAWANLVTGIADENANLDLLIGNFVDSVATAGSNIIPRLEVILGGVGDLVAKLAPTIGAEVPKLIANVLPSLLNAGIELVSGIVQGVATALPQLLQAGMDMMKTIADGLTQYIPEFSARLPAAISAVVEFITQNLPTLIDLGLNMLQAIADGILQALPEMVARLPEVVSNIVGFFDESLPSILEKGVEILNSLTDGILEAIPDLLAALPDVFDAIVTFVAENLPQIVEAGINILVNLATGIIDAIPKMVAKLPKIISSFVSTLSENFPKIVKAGFDLLLKLWDGISNAIPTLLKNIPGMCAKILKAMGAALAGVVDIGANIVKGVWQGIQNMVGWIKDKVTGFFGGIVDSVKGFLGIHSPSRVFAGIGEQLGYGLTNGINATADTAVKAAGAMAEAVTNAGTPRVGLNFKAAIPASTSFEIPPIAAGSTIPQNRAFTAAMNGGGSVDMDSLAGTVNAAVKSAIGGNENTRLLQQILEAVKAGHIIMVDGTVFGRTAIKTINNETMRAGRTLLKV